MKRIKVNTHRFFDEMGQDKVGYLFLTLSLLLLSLICVQNWMYLCQNTNDDGAGDFLYWQKVWETGNPFTPTYSNNNEMFASRTWLIYLLFYPLTHSIIISSKLTIITSTILLAFSCIYFFRKIGFNWAACFLALLIFFGFVPSQTVLLAFRFYNGYCMFYIGLFISLGILAEFEKKGKISVVKSILLFGMAIYFGLCGVRMLLFLYSPMFAFQVFRTINAKLKCREYNFKSLIFSGALLFANIVGIAIYKLLITPYMHYNGELSVWLASSGSLWDDIVAEFNTLLQCLEIVFNGSPLVSLRGLHTIFMIGVVAMLIYATWYMHKTGFLSDNEKMTLGVLSLSGAILYFVGIATSMVTATRYWVVLPIIASTLFAAMYRFLLCRKNMKLFRVVVCAVAVFGVMLSTKEIYSYQSSAPTVQMQIAQHLEEQGVKRIAGRYWYMSSFVFDSDGAFNGMHLSNDDRLQPVDWITDRTQYSNDEEPITIVIPPEDKTAWEQSEKRSHLMSTADSTEEYMGFTLLHYEHNPLALDLTQWGKEAKYNFLTLFYGGNAYLENREIILNQGGTEYGPYCSLAEGDYDVVIRGESLSLGTFDAVSPLQAYEMDNLSVEDNTVTYSIHLDADATGVELRCSNFAGVEGQIIISDITIIPRDRKPLW